MAKLDLALRNGGIVTAFGLAGLADIGILDGKIVQIGGEFEAEKEIDAREKLILPGGVDAHVHLSIPPQEEKNESNWVDNFESGSRAALAGGITTIGNITFPKENESLTEMLIRESMAAREQIIADLFYILLLIKLLRKLSKIFPFYLVMDVIV
jgi:dihydropyrimidinase